MSYEDHAAGVAEDYRDALEGLTMNSRVEINNLTLIARENTEYAHAISEVVQDHIKKISPQRKLPALYLLDSIVKNVGTPYTIYFGRGLYSTYMDAYASVDNNTRRKMEEMLKTWREPVPGSVDPRPVFQPDVTRPIENALIQARNSALQAQQRDWQNEQRLLGRRPAGPAPYRETPTPPGGRPGAPPTGPYPQRPGAAPNGAPPPDANLVQQSYPIHTTSFPTVSTPQPPPSAPAALPFQAPIPVVTPVPQPVLSIASLNDDIARLVDAAKAAWSKNIVDPDIQKKLKGLLDLQEYLKNQNLRPDELMLIKTKIDSLSVDMAYDHNKVENGTPGPNPAAAAALLIPTPSSSSSTTTTTISASYPPTQPQSHIPIVPQPLVSGVVAPPASAPPAPVSLDSLLGKGALAALLRQTGGGTTPKTASSSSSSAAHAPPPVIVPLPAAVVHAQQRVGHPAIAAAAAAATNTPPPAAAGTAANPLDLMSRLRSAGILPAVGAATPSQPMLAPIPVSLNMGLPGLIAAGTTPTIRQPLQEIRNDITLRATSLKQFRPHLLPLIYDDLGPPCTQCGRRFKTDEQGKAKKTAHMDWHFRVHQRIAEAEKRGQHRSWYVDQADWVRSRETIDVDHVDASADLGAHGGSGPGGGGGGGGRGGDGKASKTPKVQWIPAEGSGTNTVCPICQERFEMKWLDEAQEWVWMDAVKINGRAYHASCHAEATKDDPRYARGTPDPGPVLGKRKAEGDHAWRGKSKAETKVNLNDLPY